jgi:hypothetical protein
MMTINAVQLARHCGSWMGSTSPDPLMSATLPRPACPAAPPECMYVCLLGTQCLMHHIHHIHLAHVCRVTCCTTCLALPAAACCLLRQSKVPSDRRYHIVATQALIDSPMVHHLLLFACRGAAAPEVS